jgi:hypothetical protein
VRHGEPLAIGQLELVGLDHRISRALDAARGPQGAQQMPHEGGLAGAERAIQLEPGVTQPRLGLQRFGQR